MPKSTATPNFDPTAAFAMPNVDMDAFMAVQRRNVEALTTANQIAADGAKTFAALQSEILRRTMDGYAAVVTGMMAVSDPKTGAVKQAAFAKDSFEKSVDDVRELAAIATATQAKTLDVINKRVVEGMDEFQAIATKS
jgi:phasin family protein